MKHAHWILGWLFWPVALIANDEIKVEVTVTPNPTTLHQSTHLLIRSDHDLSGTELQFPVVKNLNFVYQGIEQNISSNSVSVNGRYQTQTVSSSTLDFLLQPRATGDFVIPSFKATCQGKTISIPEIKFSVNKSLGSAAHDDVSLEVSGSFPTQWYVGQCAPADVSVFITGDVNVTLTSYPKNLSENFLANHLEAEPVRSNVRRGQQMGTRYAWKTRITALHPTQDTPLDFSIDAMIRRTHPNVIDERDPFAAITAMFGLTQAEPVQIFSKPKKVQIFPLPKPRPSGFSQGIGQFKLAPPKIIEKERIQNEPCTLVVTISGTGNFDRIVAPKLIVNDKHWRTYDPKSTFEAKDTIGYDGTLTFQYPIVPLQKDNVPLPTLEFSYFDPSRKKYITLKLPEATIAVKPALRTSTPGDDTIIDAVPEKDEKQAQTEAPKSFTPSVFMGPLTWTKLQTSIPYFWWIQIALGIVTAAGTALYCRVHSKAYQTRKIYNQQLHQLKADLKKAFAHKDGLEVYTAAHALLEFQLKAKGATIQTALFEQKPPLNDSQREFLQLIEQTYQDSRFGRAEVQCPKNLAAIQQLFHSLQ